MIKTLFCKIFFALGALMLTFCATHSSRIGKAKKIEIIEELMSQLVLIEEGTFMMGCSDPDPEICWDDASPMRKVTVSSFYISKFEFTHRLYFLVTGSYNVDYDNCLDCPVTFSNYSQLSQLIKLINRVTGKEFRLPTEAEWEYAAQGGKHSQNYRFSGSNDLSEVAWHGGNSKGRLMPVGQKKPNEAGLYDMTGNAREWCSDWYHPEYYSWGNDLNPKGPEEGSSKVIRGGGSLSNQEFEFRVWDRFADPGGGWYYAPGFRLALSVN